VAVRAIANEIDRLRPQQDGKSAFDFFRRTSAQLCAAVLDWPVDIYGCSWDGKIKAGADVIGFLSAHLKPRRLRARWGKPAAPDRIFP
jgi:hypothetical protein